MPFGGANYDETLELLKRARERVAAGWCQGPACTPDGRFCAWGALIYDPIDSRRHEDEAIAALFRALPFWYRFTFGNIKRASVISYNEDGGRRQHQIVALYDRAIARRAAA